MKPVFRLLLPGRRLALPVAAALLLAGCNTTWQKSAEFAPPESRWPQGTSSTASADAPPPPVQTVHCYRTLAAVDCYAEKQPQRYYGYTGTYPAN